MNFKLKIWCWLRCDNFDYVVWVRISDMWVSHEVAHAREHRIPALQNLKSVEGGREEKVI